MKQTIVTFALFLVACGAATQSHVLETRSDAPEYLEAIHRAAVARGLTAQYAEERQVAIVLDRETRTRINFQARRNGVVLGVSTAGGEDVPPDVQQAELARGEELGRQIYAEAAAQWNQILQERELEASLRAEEERLAAERRAARRAERRQQMEDNAELRAFMEQNRERTRAIGQSNEPATNDASGNTAGNNASSGNNRGQTNARCCINGSYYLCPNAAALDQCAGRFARCMAREGMMGMESCLQSDPPDPSQCERRSDLDGQCG